MKSGVSVIVTVYKRTRFLREALDSALAQTLPPDEIIVTDDSNSREIREICESYGSGPVRYRSNPKNLGVSKNLRSALVEVHGPYVAILNDDDAWEPEFLEKLTHFLRDDPEAVVAFCNHWIVTETGDPDIKLSQSLDQQYGRASLKQGIVPDARSLVIEKKGIPIAMASLFRKEALNLELLVPEVAGAYDYWISCLLVAKGGRAYFEPERLTRYRVHSAMETARKSPDRFLDLAYIYRELLLIKEFNPWSRLLRKRLRRTYIDLGVNHLRFGMRSESRQFFVKAGKLDGGVYALAGWCATFLPFLPFMPGRSDSAGTH